MKRKHEVTRTIGFDEVIALVGCPYCHAVIYDPCRGVDQLTRRRVKILDSPHKSRAMRAFDVRDGKTNSNRA